MLTSRDSTEQVWAADLQPLIAAAGIPLWLRTLGVRDVTTCAEPASDNTAGELVRFTADMRARIELWPPQAEWVLDLGASRKPFQISALSATQPVESMVADWLRERRQRVQGLATYLREIETGGYISASTAADARRIWDELNRATHARLPVPNASPGPDGMLLLTWDRREHHLELEFLPEKPPVFFYFDRHMPGGLEIAYGDYSGTRGVRERLFSVFSLFF